MDKIVRCFSNCCSDIVKIFKTTFTPMFLVIHVLALLVVFLIIYSGLDLHFNYFTYNLTENNHFLITYSGISYLVGHVLPLFLLFVCIVLILINKINIKIYFLSLSVVVSTVFVSIYKSFTARISPTCNKGNMDFSCYTDNFAVDSFTFEFLKNGINWGFPSGHATSTVALGILFILLFWRNKFITFLSILYTFVVLIGISLRWHWVSDIVAGIFFGVLIALACYGVYKKNN